MKYYFLSYSVFFTSFHCIYIIVFFLFLVDSAPPREGAYISGLFMEGARWDVASGMIAESKLKELFPQMPVIYVKALIEDKHDLINLYECPIYKTRMRGPTYVWTFNLRTREKPAKWIVAGVALLLSV